MVVRANARKSPPWRGAGKTLRRRESARRREDYVCHTEKNAKIHNGRVAGPAKRLSLEEEQLCAFE